MIHDTQSAQISQRQDERNLYAIMKTMCPPGYHHNGFVATHALGHMMYVYIYICIYIYIEREREIDRSIDIDIDICMLCMYIYART